MATPDLLERGRAAFARRAWSDAFMQLAAADRGDPLAPDDLRRLAIAAHLTGRDAESTEAWTRAHHDLLARGDIEAAARCAFWLGFGLLHHGERARGGAWIGRARQLLDARHGDCVEQGYVLLPAAMERLMSGDLPGAYALFCQAAEIAMRFDEPDLLALARHSRGRVLIRMGETRQGLALLDEAMVAIDAHEVSPMVVGDVYCSVIEGCLELFDLRRAQEWTLALTRWCEAQPDLVPYRGQCLARRAEILQWRGVWPDATEEAERACERFVQGPDQPAAGEAFYQRADLHRLQGRFSDADEAYRRASRYGRRPQPGLALLRLTQGDVDAAAAAIRLALDETSAPISRSKLLPAYVEIMLAAGDVAAAEQAADELATIAGSLEAPLLAAAAAQARGGVLLAQDRARASLPLLRQAWNGWQDLEVPFQAARTRVAIGLACRALGDHDAAEMEFDAARWVFRQLGAVPDLARLDALSHRAGPRAANGLSARESEVLRLLATGKSNRAIAQELFISERTVERHVSNIFIKLDVSSRTAATAYAYEHQLL